MMEFKGLYTERLYFKDFQEKSGFKMEVVRLGKYKSAVEPFLAQEIILSTGMSTLDEIDFAIEILTK
mgnify:CR=1 FL=1